MLCSVASAVSSSLWSMDCSAPGSSAHGILQARILEWVVMPSSQGSSQPRNQTHISSVSCTSGRFFTHWSTWEAQGLLRAGERILGNHAGLIKPLLSYGKAANKWFRNECWVGIESWCFIYRRLKAYATLAARKFWILWDCHWQEGAESCHWINISGDAGEKHFLLEDGLLAVTAKN